MSLTAYYARPSRAALSSPVRLQERKYSLEPPQNNLDTTANLLHNLRVSAGCPDLHSYTKATGFFPLLST